MELKKRVEKEGRLGWDKRVLLQKKKLNKRSKHSRDEGGEATDGEGIKVAE